LIRGRRQNAGKGEEDAAEADQRDLIKWEERMLRLAKEERAQRHSITLLLLY